MCESVCFVHELVQGERSLELAGLQYNLNEVVDDKRLVVRSNFYVHDQSVDY